MATFVNSCFHADDMAALLVLAGKYADIETGAHILSAALLLSAVLVNVWVYVAIRKIKPSNFDWWVSAFFLAFILFCIVVSVTGSIVTGKPVTELFFGMCCASLGAVGAAWGLDYKEICVVVNIYVQSGICLLSALWLSRVLVLLYIRKKCFSRFLLMAAGICIGVAYLLGFIWACRHYAMPLADAYNLCVHELIMLTKEYGTTYYNVNYAIFIILFLILTIGNIAIAETFRKRCVANRRGKNAIS